MHRSNFQRRRSSQVFLSRMLGTSLAVQWLRLRASTVGGTGSIPGGEDTKILYASRLGKKNTTKNEGSRNYIGQKSSAPDGCGTTGTVRSSLGNWVPQHVPKGMGYVGPSKDTGSTRHQPSGAPAHTPPPHRLMLHSTLAQLGPLGLSGELFCFSFGSQRPLLPTYHTRPPGAAVDRMAGEKAALSVSVGISCISKPQA